MKNAFLFFCIQFFNYGAIAIYTRFVAQAAIGPAVALDVVFAAINYFVIRRIAKSEEDIKGFIGYVLGSALGTYVGIHLTLLMGH